MRAPIIICYMIPEYSELFLYAIGSTNTSLFDMQLSRGMGHRMVALVRVINLSDLGSLFMTWMILIT